MKTVFLDRDGVICYNRADHVKSWAEFRFLPGAVEGLVALTRGGCRTVVITNQAIVNRGQVPAARVEEIHAHMIAHVAAAGGQIDRVLYCPHRPDEGCGCRKPRPGMVLTACRDYGIASAQTYLVGDHWTDIQAGQRAGCRTTLVLTGRGRDTLLSGAAPRLAGYRIAPSLKHAVAHILADGLPWQVRSPVWHGIDPLLESHP